MSRREDMMELGLLAECDAKVQMYDSEGSYESICSAPVLNLGGRCSKHDGSIEMKAELNLVKTRAALAEKQRLEDEILPLATERVMSILVDPDAKDADIIKIWMTTMDRIGLAAVSGLIVEDITQKTPPLDVLRDLLRQTPAGPVAATFVVDSTLADDSSEMDDVDAET